jgi:site-specific recombinase XerD
VLDEHSGEKDAAPGQRTVQPVATGTVQPPAVGVRTHRLSPETLRLYVCDWAGFAAHCAATGARTLPPTPETVIGFLEAGSGRAALRRRLAAIDYRHRQLGLTAPGDAQQVRAALKRARKQLPRRTRKEAPTQAELRRMAQRCPGDLAGRRDRALLLLLAAGLTRREVVVLQAERVRFTVSGATVAAKDQQLELLRAAAGLCPVRALEDWLRASDTRYGPVFRKVNRWGTLETQQLGADAVRVILARRSAA